MNQINPKPHAKKTRLSPREFAKGIMGVSVELLDTLAERVTSYQGGQGRSTPQMEFRLKMQLLANNVAIARVMMPTYFSGYPKINRLIKVFDQTVESFIKETISERRMRKLLIVMFRQCRQSLWDAAEEGSLQHVAPMLLQSLLQDTIADDST